MTRKKVDFWATRTSPMDEAEVKEIALSVVRGGRWQYIRPENLKLQALPLMAGLSGYTKKSISHVGTVLGDGNNTGGAVNGLACYFGLRFVHHDDWERIKAKIQAIEEALDAV